MARITKILGFSVPPSMAKMVNAWAKEEGRTKSELFREMLRVYKGFRKYNDRDLLKWLSQEPRVPTTKAIAESTSKFTTGRYDG